MQIVVRQISGLGNQLFQYAAARYYAKRYQATVTICVDPARSANSHGYGRPFLLSHFSLISSFREATLSERLMFTEKPGLRTVSAILKRALRVGIVAEPISSRYNFLERLPIDAGLRVVYLVGYWQTYKAAAAIESELRDEFHLKQPAHGRSLELLEEIKRTRNSVSLHVRRGDFALAAEGNIALPMAYYVRAISIFRERLADPAFFVFSDDINYARTYLSGGPGMTFVDHNDDDSSYEDLRLMSSCQHHIIANSTFSWWGAWLNPASDKIVIAPRHWHLSEDSYYPDLLPPDWVLVDTCEDTISPGTCLPLSLYAN